MTDANHSTVRLKFGTVPTQIWDSPDEIKLKSYDTFVASIKDNQLVIVDGIKNWSQTTKRHIREFAKQYGYINDVK